MIALADENQLHLLEFHDQFSEVENLKKFKTVSENRGNTVLKSIKSELEQYFRGQLTRFDTPLKLNGTEFQNNCWHQLIKIPYGKTITYGQQAEALEIPKSYRAVAKANSQNVLAIIVPCHRVVGVNGMAGYRGGVDRKQYLLDLETNKSFL